MRNDDTKETSVKIITFINIPKDKNISNICRLQLEVLKQEERD